MGEHVSPLRWCDCAGNQAMNRLNNLQPKRQLHRPVMARSSAVANLRWYELFPPHGCSLTDVTAVIRVLAGRARHGIWRTTPVVVFECWIEQGNVRWLLGLDERLATTLPAQLPAQLPSLDLAEVATPSRPPLRSAMTVRSAGLSYPLKLDNAAAVASGCMQIASTLGKRERVVVQWVVGPAAPRHTPPSQFTISEALGLRPPRKPEVGEQRAWHAKVEEPLFAVQGRIGAVARNTPRANALLKLALDALSLADSPHARLQRGRISQATTERLITVIGSGRSWSSVLNASELAMLITWPLAGVPLPGHSGVLVGRAPAALLVPPDDATSPGDRFLGVSLHPADGEQLVTVPAAGATYHTAITGPTGSGKSNAVARMILADAALGHSVLVVEPKGDLIADVLSRLDERRHHQVVVIEPSESGPVVGLNPLAGPPEEAERRADELLHLFRELFGSAIGPRSADVLLHSLITTARLPDGALTDVPVLLTNPQFRRRALAKVSDPLVLAPFWAQFDGFSDGERTQVVAPVLNKLRAFLSRSSIRRMLGQATPRFSVDELFTRPRIVLVNLNRGLLGSETCRIIGALVLTQCWQAIQRRAAVPRTRRHPVVITVDEFQDFVGALDFAEVLSQSRGLGAGWTLLHQNLDQLHPRLAAACLANARSRVAFRPAQKDVRVLADVLGVTPTALEQLGAYEACARLCIDGAMSPPFAVRTLPLPKAAQNAAMLRRHSLERYGVSPTELDDALTTRWQGGDRKADGPVGVTRRRSS
ncbi:DNA helicase HerA-like ATPase [Kibdelosporangium banguiense]|uniref:DNA helicase HerA-like ATPase n=1 Tax=Kibdelosporangium banguiense TaxID=1365924 RepID=A0ABS4TE37_9PSEU|nr:type IV secretion system DNA-binding domain-containing protein [Kibdelosporangium banguiense]MBP2322680.1 DNA helicase HerA-like ATPase [Kibdelosporangium banguiense]